MEVYQIPKLQVYTWGYSYVGLYIGPTYVGLYMRAYIYGAINGGIHMWFYIWGPTYVGLYI